MQLGKPMSDLTALREDEFSYRQLFDNMEEGFALHEIITDATGKVIDFRFLAANPAFDRHTGLQGAAIVGKTMLEVVPGADQDRIEAYGRVALTGKPLSFEYRSETFGRDVRVRAYSPSPGRFATIFEDITERKLAEEKLARSEAMYRLLAENASDAVFMVDADGKEVYISPSLARLLGYAESDLGRLDPATRLEFIHPDDRTAALAELKQAKELRHPHSSLQYRIKNKQGDYIWIEINLRREFDSSGQLLREIGIVRDISDRKMIETALRQSEEKIAKAFALNPAGIAISRRADGCYLEANPAYLQLVGYSRDELIGRRSTELGIVSSEERALIMRTVDAQATPIPFDTRLHIKTGTTLDVITAIDTVEVGSELCLLTIVVDASDPKRLQAANDRLAAIVESSGEAIVSTDMRGIIVSWNRTAEQIYGHKASDAIGRHIDTYLPPRPTSDAVGILAQLRSGAVVTLPDDSFVNRNGMAIELAAIMSPVIDRAGEMIGIALIARDITERKRMDTAVRESEQRYRMLADNIPDVVFALDATGRPTYVSPSIERMRSITVEEALVEVRRSRYAADSLSEVERHLAKSLAEAEAGLPLSEPYHDAEHRRKDVRRQGRDRLRQRNVVERLGGVGVEDDEHGQVFGIAGVLEVVEVALGGEDRVPRSPLEHVLGGVGADEAPPHAPGQHDVHLPCTRMPVRLAHAAGTETREVDSALLIGQDRPDPGTRSLQAATIEVVGCGRLQVEQVRVVGIDPSPTSFPTASWMANEDLLLCTSRPTYRSIGLPPVFLGHQK